MSPYPELALLVSTDANRDNAASGGLDGNERVGLAIILEKAFPNRWRVVIDPDTSKAEIT